MAHAEVKGIVHSPNQGTSVISANCEGLLFAIAKARVWINGLLDGSVASFAEIAEREGRVERHIRLLAPLAFVSPRFISEIVDGVVPPNITVTGLAHPASGYKIFLPIVAVYRRTRKDRADEADEAAPDPARSTTTRSDEI
jgi:hypothetical protein